jgi:hypothetical protein
MDYLSKLPNEIRCEIYSYLTPQQILYSCCSNKVSVKFLTDEFWHQHVTRTYCPQDFGVKKFDTNSLAYLNVASWTELAKLSFASRTIPAVMTPIYRGYTERIINTTFELNFFSSFHDIKRDLIKYFKLPRTHSVKILIKGRIDKNTEVGISFNGEIGTSSGEFGILGWGRDRMSFDDVSQVVTKKLVYGDNVHIGLFTVGNINFFSKIEKIELRLSVTRDFITSYDKNIKISSTRQETLLSQINTHILQHGEKREGYIESLCKSIFSYWLN